MTGRFARISALMLALAVLASGCASILEDDTGFTVPHTVAVVTAQSGDAPEAANYDELYAALSDLMMQHAKSGKIQINGYDGDMHADIDRACLELKTNDPIGAYALSEITAEATQIVSYFEVEAELRYKRTKEQVDSRINIATIRYFRTELLSFMSEYVSGAVIWTDLHDLSAEEIEGYVRELYYENPLSVVMLPSVGVEQFPADARDGPRIFELTFGYRSSDSLLRSYNMQLRETVSHIAETISGGDNDGKILLELASKLAESCEYNEGQAVMIAEHGVQSFDATAYGALLLASAVGEGYALAYKALCDELGFECYVVLGTLDGAAHAWNIVALEGDYYHIDVAMCAKNGIDTAFLLRDEDLPEKYVWDRLSSRACEGELTYADFAEIPEAEDTIDEPPEDGSEEAVEVTTEVTTGEPEEE